MAQKATKSLATRNTARLKQTHLITLALHALFLLSRFTFRRSLSLWRYTLLSAPALVIEFYLDTISRPKYSAEGNVKSAGEDLDAKGLTEFMFDVVYWTWINLVLVVLVGNRGWWAYLVVPGYAIYSAVGIFSGVKSMMGGLQGGGADGETMGTEAKSKRQGKMEKRGGQKVQYR
jgi:hypothetical protein